MSVAMDRMHAFMSALKSTNQSGRGAVDDAVRSCSSFQSAQDWIDSFVNEYRNYTANGQTQDAFLKNVCGVDLTNADTGAISGSDAGGDTVLDKNTIVPENDISKSYYPIATKIVDGQTYYYVKDASTGGLAAYFPYITDKDDVRYRMTSGLITWWMKQDLTLIERSYGYSIQNPSSYKIFFDYTDSDSYVGQTYGYANQATISMSLKSYSDIKRFYSNRPENANGISTTMSNPGFYADRVYAHELTHAVMMNNLKSGVFGSLPEFITEGLAELVHGGDDARSYSITHDLTNPDALAASLDFSAGTGDNDTYAAGYLALRYLMKNGGSTYSGTGGGSTDMGDYDLGGDRLTVKSGYQGFVGGSSHSYLDSVQIIDGSSSTGNVGFIGNSQNNQIIAGSGIDSLWGGATTSSDTLQGGTGTDYFFYGEGNGNDVVTNYNGSEDYVDFYGGSLSGVSVSGNDVILQSGSGSLTVQNAAGNKLNLLTASGASFSAWIGTDTDSIVYYGTDRNYYYGAAGHTNILRVADSANIWLNNTTGTYYFNLENIDASSSTGTEVLAGSNDAANQIIGGQGTSSIWGGSGNFSDTLCGGSGTDTFYYGAGDGSDYIINTTSADKVVFYSTPSFSSLILQGNDLSVGMTDGSVLTINEWSESGMNTFQLADGSQWKLRNENGNITAHSIG